MFFTLWYEDPKAMQEVYDLLRNPRPDDLPEDVMAALPIINRRPTSDEGIQFRKLAGKMILGLQFSQLLTKLPEMLDARGLIPTSIFISRWHIELTPANSGFYADSSAGWCCTVETYLHNGSLVQSMDLEAPDINAALWVLNKVCRGEANEFLSIKL